MAATESIPEDADRLAVLTVLVPDGVPVRSRADTAYFLIRDLVVTLAMPPGSPVDERALMERLGLGRTPVREALRRLADEGLITIWPRRGMVVAPVDARDLAAISAVRLELEGLAARLAAERAGEGVRRDSAALAAELGKVSSDPHELIRLDQRIHRCVFTAAGNRYLSATCEEYLILSLRLWFLGLERVHRLDEAVREHRDLLDAVAAGDPDAAERTVRDHIRGFQAEIGRVLSGA